jgi:hypothetical protein
VNILVYDFFSRILGLNAERSTPLKESKLQEKRDRSRVSRIFKREPPDRLVHQHPTPHKKKAKTHKGASHSGDKNYRKSSMLSSACNSEYLNLAKISIR